MRRLITAWLVSMALPIWAAEGDGGAKGATGGPEFGESSGIAAGFHLGVVAGYAAVEPSLSTMEARAGLSSGGFVEIRAGEHLFLQPEIGYSERGYVDKTGGSETIFKYDVLHLPLLLKGKFGVGARKRIHLNFLGGPTVSFRLNAKSVTSTASAKLLDSTEPIALALTFGGGIDIWLAPTAAIVVQLRYSHGLTDITKNRTVRLRDVELLTGLKLTL